MTDKCDSKIIEHPYVSIIVPVFNGERFVRLCMESINRINYPKDRFELIMVDNGSSDKTVETIRHFQKNLGIDVKLYVEKRKGAYMARNLGIRNAKGEIVVFTDADCIVDENWLTNIVGYFSEKSIGAVAGEILPKRGNSIVERYAISVEMWSQKALFNARRLPFAQTGNVAYRKDVFSKIGYFAEIFSGGDADYSWRMLLETDYKIIYASDAIVIHDHKIDMKGLFRQTFRYGSGYIYLQNKYGSRYENPKYEIKSNNPTYIIKVSRYLINNRNDMLLIFPALVHTLGFNTGKIYAKFIKRWLI